MYNCAGESVAALASAAVLFEESDPAYSDTLVQHAEQLFEFADANKGLYSSSISDAGQFYRCGFAIRNRHNSDSTPIPDQTAMRTS